MRIVNSVSQWQQDFAAAKAAWVGTAEELTNVVTVFAEAGTGSRYVVTVSALGPQALQQIGGAMLVSVMYPWKAVYPVNTIDLHESYVYEKFGPDGRMPNFGGDAAGLVLTIGLALQVFNAQREAASHAETAH